MFDTIDKGELAKDIVAKMVADARSITVTEFESLFATYALLLASSIATSIGKSPAVSVEVTTLVDAFIILTLLLLEASVTTILLVVALNPTAQGLPNPVIVVSNELLAGSMTRKPPT